MNADNVVEFISGFAERHATTFHYMSLRQTQLLELALILAFADHYSKNGYEVESVNPSGDAYIVKTSSRGQPTKYSRFVVSRNRETYEIHMNLNVRSAHDEGIYCVDVAVVDEGHMPRENDNTWRCISNENLITFAEAKKITIYPMLIAQFIGIVHEIKPEFLRPVPRAFIANGHILPTLASLGMFSANAQVIVEGLMTRNYSLIILEAFDTKLARLRSVNAPSVWNVTV